MNEKIIIIMAELSQQLVHHFLESVGSKVAVGMHEHREEPSAAVAATPFHTREIDSGRARAMGGNYLLDCVVFGRVAGAACAKYMLGDKVKPTLLAELSGEGLTGKVEVFKLAGGSYGDAIVSNFLSQHPGGELATFTFAGKDATSEFDMFHPPDAIEKYAPEYARTKSKRLIEKFENHKHEESFIQDLSQTQKINKFSKESKDLIADLNNTEIFELCENSSKQQCPDCNLYWEIGIIYCSCGRNMKSTRSPTEFDQNNRDVTSIPGCVIKNKQQSWSEARTF